MNFADFFSQVGEAMFGGDWEDPVPPDKVNVSRAERNAAQERTVQVIDQIKLALEAQYITAVAILNLLPRLDKTNHNDPSDDDEFEELDLLDEDDFDEDSQQRHYPILSSFWSGHWPYYITSWQFSQLEIPVKFLLVADSSPYGNDEQNSRTLFESRKDLNYPTAARLEAPVKILKADAAIAAMIPLSSMDQKQIKQHFSAFPNRYVDEIVMAAWRAIAIMRPTKENTKVNLVVSYMNDYLDAQEIDGYKCGLSDSLKKAIAEKIVAQVKNSNITSQVFMNSTPAGSTKIKRPSTR